MSATLFGQQKAQKMHVGKDPTATIGPSLLPILLPFNTLAQAVYALNFNPKDYNLGFVQSVFADNSAGNSTLFLNFGPQKIAVPPYSQGMYPVFTGDQVNLIATSASNVDIEIILTNTELQYGVWSSITQQVTGTVSVTGSTIYAEAAPLTFTDRSGAIVAGGTAQLLAAANGARKNLIIQNGYSAAVEGIGVAEPLYWSATANNPSPGVGMELLPGGTVALANFGITTQAIYIYGATTGHKFTAWEG